MTKSYVSGGQSIFVFGIDPTQRLAVDSTKLLDGAAEAVAGFPLVLVASTGKLNSTSAATGTDVYYGASSTNINDFYGRVSLENWTALRANAEMVGRYTIRPSVFLDSNQIEVTAYPFTAANGSVYTVQTSDVGKAVNTALVTVADASDAFNGKTMFKWTLATSGFVGSLSVGRIVAVRDNGEVEVWIDGTGRVITSQ